MTLFGLFFVLFIEGFIKPQAMKRKSIALTVFLAVGIVFGSYSLHAQASDWSVPDKYHNMKNPVPADKASIASRCARCGFDLPCSHRLMVANDTLSRAASCS